MGYRTRWHVVLSGMNNERHYYPVAPKGCDIDAILAAREEWQKEFGELDGHDVKVVLCEEDS